MANRSDIKAGRAYVELFTKGLSVVKKDLKGLATSVTNIGASVFKAGLVIASTFAAIVAALAKPIQMAGDLAETISKFEAVFGRQTEAMKEWADDFAKSIGRAKSETMTGLATFQAFFQGLGAGNEQAAKFSKRMQQLAVDFASFHNLQDAEAMQRFISALSGSGEVLAMFGVNIMEAALNAKLLQLGFPTISKGATEFQKVLARMAIIEESMGRQGAIGDALRTAGSFSNQMKAAKAAVREFAEEVGTLLLPVVTPLVTKFKDIVKSVGQMVTANPELVATFAKLAVVGVAVGLAIAGVGAAIMAVGAVSGSFVAVVGAITALATPVGAIIATVVLLPVALAGATVAWLAFTKAGRNTFSQLIEGAKAFGGIAKDTFAGVANALKGGDIELAWQIVVQDMTTTWWAFIAEIHKGFDEVLKGFANLWEGIFAIEIEGVGKFNVGLKDMLPLGPGGREGVEAALDAAHAAATEGKAGADILKDESAQKAEELREKAKMRAADIGDGYWSLYNDPAASGEPTGPMAALQQAKSAVLGFNPNALLRGEQVLGSKNPEFEESKKHTTLLQRIAASIEAMTKPKAGTVFVHGGA